MSMIIDGTSGATFPDSSTQAKAGLVAGGTIASGTITALNTNGITFPASQSASSDANTLDDYEEGTWTPTISSSAAPTVTYLVQTAIYTKIGRQVTVYGRVGLTAKSGGSGSAYIGGLPFTATSVAGAVNIGYVSSLTLPAGLTYPSLYINAADGNKLFFAGSGSGVAAQEIPIANIGSSIDLSFSCTYFV